MAWLCNPTRLPLPGRTSPRSRLRSKSGAGPGRPISAKAAAICAGAGLKGRNLIPSNTSCYHCHVSQLSKNYSIETDTYRTTWGEPGINCESCHGPGRAHLAAMRAAGDRVDKNKLETIVVRKFDSAQTNSMCAPCHAKMSPLDTGFQAGKRYFDHYNLALLEDRDFYPDGRDLGENFTYGSSARASPRASSTASIATLLPDGTNSRAPTRTRPASPATPATLKIPRLICFIGRKARAAVVWLATCPRQPLRACAATITACFLRRRPQR